MWNLKKWRFKFAHLCWAVRIMEELLPEHWQRQWSSGWRMCLLMWSRLHHLKGSLAGCALQHEGTKKEKATAWESRWHSVWINVREGCVLAGGYIFHTKLHSVLKNKYLSQQSLEFRHKQHRGTMMINWSKGCIFPPFSSLFFSLSLSPSARHLVWWDLVWGRIEDEPSKFGNLVSQKNIGQFRSH
jgi:hypothetical protein